MNNLLQKGITGNTAVKIAASVEQAIRAGRLAPGDRLPTVRRLATHLQVSPATVASADRSLQARAVLAAGGRRGTCVTHRPMASARRRLHVDASVVNLSDGNPDPSLLPDFGPVLRKLKYTARLYGSDSM